MVLHKGIKESMESIGGREGRREGGKEKEKRRERERERGEREREQERGRGREEGEKERERERGGRIEKKRVTKCDC